MYKFYQSEKRGLHLSFHEYNGNIQQINIPKIKDTLLCYKNSHNQYWVQRISEVNQTKEFDFHHFLPCNRCLEIHVTKTDQQCVKYYRSKVTLYQHSPTLPPVSFSVLELMSFAVSGHYLSLWFSTGCLEGLTAGSFVYSHSLTLSPSVFPNSGSSFFTFMPSLQHLEDYPLTYGSKMIVRICPALHRTSSSLSMKTVHRVVCHLQTYLSTVRLQVLQDT